MPGQSLGWLACSEPGHSCSLSQCSGCRARRRYGTARWDGQPDYRSALAYVAQRQQPGDGIAYNDHFGGRSDLARGSPSSTASSCTGRTRRRKPTTRTSRVTDKREARALRPKPTPITRDERSVPKKLLDWVIERQMHPVQILGVPPIILAPLEAPVGV